MNIFFLIQYLLWHVPTGKFLRLDFRDNISFFVLIDSFDIARCKAFADLRVKILLYIKDFILSKIPENLRNSQELCRNLQLFLKLLTLRDLKGPCNNYFWNTHFKSFSLTYNFTTFEKDQNQKVRSTFFRDWWPWVALRSQISIAIKDSLIIKSK